MDLQLAPENDEFRAEVRAWLEANVPTEPLPSMDTAEGFDAELTISRDGFSVGGRSIMGLMMLAASQGSTIEVTATGPEAEGAIEAIAELVANRFGEDC